MKETTAARALAVVRSRSRVFLGTACGEPQTLVEALVAEHERLVGVEVITGLQGSSAPYADPRYARSFRLRTFMVTAAVRGAVESGAVEYIPCSLSRIGSLFTSGAMPLDFALVQVSPPDRHGFCSLGTTVSYTHTALRSARVVIAEVNERMPRTHGEGFVHVDEIDFGVRSDRPLLEVEPAAPTPELTAIGRNVASLVPDRAVVQVGVGGIADATWRALTGHSGLGVHSGSLADSVVDLIEGGAVTNEHKALWPGRSVAGQLIGTRRLYDYADDNPALMLAPATITHDAAVIARLADFHSINSALQVDLRGQVNSETLRGRQVAGTGGALDFAMGAQLSSGGRSIVALPARSRKGHSRIVARLDKEAVTVPASTVDFVVTEHGIAELAGKSIADRAAALIEIAAPDAREEIERERDRT
jgi:4-hydroxybutyrate CoA-transferase